MTIRNKSAGTIALILILIVHALPALAAKDDVKLWENHYYGILGANTQISAYFTGRSEGVISGAYRYVRIGTPIRVSGQLKSNGEFDLLEISTKKTKENKHEPVTGRLTGAFDRSFDTIKGTWASPDGQKTFPISLKKGILIDLKQIDEPPSNKGFLVNMPSVPLSEAKSFCNAIGSSADERRTKVSCKTKDFSRIAELNGVEYFQGTYQEKGKWQDSSNYQQNCVVLFEVANDRAKPFWCFTERGDGSSLEMIELLKEKTGPLFEVTYNSGGTLPPWSDFIIQQKNGFSIIDTDSLEHEVSDIARIMGYVTRNALGFDFTQRQASNVLYKGNDPNCCGSAGITLNFVVSGNRLKLKDYKVISEQQLQ